MLPWFQTKQPLLPIIFLMLAKLCDISQTLRMRRAWKDGKTAVFQRGMRAFSTPLVNAAAAAALSKFNHHDTKTKQR
jgi:hypothetical protein